MTLSELADLVTTKMHRTDTQSIAEAKTYIKARYKMLWDSRPWRDAISTISIPAESVTRTMILPRIVDRVMAVRWGDKTNLLPQDLGTVFSVDPGLFERTGQPAGFSIISPSAVAVSPASGKIFVTSSDPNATYSVSIRGIYGSTEVYETITLAGKSVISSVNSYDEIYDLSKDSTGSDLIVTKADSSVILNLDAPETSRQHQRIYFQVTPDYTLPLLILFKRRFKPLVNDSDSPEIAGIDNALLAAALADMQEGQRQYGKAQVKMQESSLMAQQMADLERHQSAASSQLVPWDAAMAPDDFGYANLP